MKKTKLLKKVLLVTLAAGVCLGCGMGAREVRAEETGGLYQGGKLVYNWEELQNQGYITLYRNRDTIKTTKKFKELSGDLVIPDSVKKIDEYGFVGTHLDTVTFPGSLVEIGKTPSCVVMI